MNKFAQEIKSEEIEDRTEFEGLPVQVVWKSNGQPVWEGTQEQFAEDFPNGLDEDNSKIFEIK